MNSSYLCSTINKLLALPYAPEQVFLFSFLAIGGANVWEKRCSLCFASNVDIAEQRLIQIWLFKYVIN